MTFSVLGRPPPLVFFSSHSRVVGIPLHEDVGLYSAGSDLPFTQRPPPHLPPTETVAGDALRFPCSVSCGPTNFPCNVMAVVAHLLLFESIRHVSRIFPFLFTSPRVGLRCFESIRAFRLLFSRFPALFNPLGF